jgi:hypothetical protein
MQNSFCSCIIQINAVLAMHQSDASSSNK